MGQLEINWKSVYMSKSVDGKLKMGPVWDFDWSVTGPHADFKYKEIYKDNCEGFRSYDNWFISLYNGSPEFRLALEARWTEVRPLILSELEAVKAEKSTIERAAVKDWYRWFSFRSKGSFSEYYDEVFEWVGGRVLWLDGAFCAS